MNGERLGWSINDLREISNAFGKYILMPPTYKNQPHERRTLVKNSGLNMCFIIYTLLKPNLPSTTVKESSHIKQQVKADLWRR